MKILIAGGAGEVGTYLARDFSNWGHQVTVIDRVTRPEIVEDRSITYLHGNLTDAAFVDKSIQGMEVVLHLAWSFADDAATIFGEDIEGHINLLEAASSARVRHLVYTSTATVYGRAVLHPVTETHPCLLGEARKPLYALGKFTAEELCRFYSKERGLSATIFRFWWAFGDTIGGAIYGIWSENL